MKDVNVLITDDWDIPVDELVEAFMCRAFIFQNQQRALKAKADFNEVGGMGPL